MALFDGMIFWLVRYWAFLSNRKMFRWHRQWGGANGGMPDPAVPACCNDKYYWRKLFDHDPRFPVVSDKLAVKDWLREESIDIEIAPVLWSGTDPATIPDDLLKADIILKANHASATNMFIAGGKFDRSEVETKANNFLGRRYWRRYGEWGYKNITPTLLIEPLIGDIEAGVSEYKFYTCGRRIERLVAIHDRQTAVAADVFAPDGDGLVMTDEVSSVSPNRAHRPLPDTGPRMIELARELGARFDHMRVDLLSDGRQIWFGELTLYNLGGHVVDRGQDPDDPLNTSWDLRSSWFLSTPQKGWRRFYAGALRRHLERQQSASTPA